MALKADIQYEGVEWQEMAKYIKVSLTVEEIEDAGLEELHSEKFTDHCQISIYIVLYLREQVQSTQKL